MRDGYASRQPSSPYRGTEGGLPQFVLDFLRELPTRWDEVQFLDGYPTRYVVLTRRTGNRWYVAGLNGTTEPKTLKVGRDGKAKVTMQPLGGLIITSRP